MSRILVLLYGVASYVLFLISFLWAIAFVGNMYVGHTIDSPGTDSFGTALMINALLLGIFAISHSVMARPGFKKAWTKIIPQSIERSTYVLVSSATLILIFTQWSPMNEVIWSISGMGATVLNVLFWAGWVLVLLSTFMINHFDLFGLRQVWMRYKETDYRDLPFTTAFAYKFIRHPLLLGFVIAFWAAPTMTMGHLIFAIATTAYMLIAIQLEEKDMEAVFGDTYRAYKSQVPMMIPTGKTASPPTVSAPAPAPVEEPMAEEGAPLY